MVIASSISGLPIYAPSAAFAPTNSAEVSAIASAYQVVSSTATQLYAGTAYVTSVNDAPLSASRAGNAANASLASSAWYDGTGRLISSLPDSAAVSAIASAYAESAASSKQDTLTFDYDDDKISAINGSALAGQGGGGASGDYVETSATNVAIGSSVDARNDDTFAQGRYCSSNDRGLAQGYHNRASSDSFAQGSYNNANIYSFAQGSDNNAASDGFAQGYKNTGYNHSLAQGERNSADMYSFAQGSYNTAYGCSFAQGSGVSAKSTAVVFGRNNLSGEGYGSPGVAFVIGDGTASSDRHDLMVVTKDGEITMYSGTADTAGTGIMSSIRALSANAGGVDSATCSAIASSYAESAVSGKADSSALSSYVPYSSLEYNTASAISGINGSALAAGSTYSAGEGIDITDDVISVEAPVDIVAGPGIVIDNPDGNTLRVSTDENYEVELYKNSGVPNSNTNDVFTLTESVTNFERIRVEFWNREFNQFRVTLEYYIIDSSTSTQFVASMDHSTGTSNIQRVNMIFSYNSAGNIVDNGHNLFYGNGGNHTNGNNRGLGIHRIVGIHRINGGN